MPRTPDRARTVPSKVKPSSSGSLRITGNGRTFEQKSGRLDVTMLQQIPPELDQASDL
jgi:hypothetical protein